MSALTVCAACGAGTAPDAVFCGNCGAALALPGRPTKPAPVVVPSAVGHVPERPAAPPRWGAGHDLTRYLCAAAYLDRDYATSLVGQVAAEPHLGVAPAPACDVPVVLRHAYLANVRRNYRDLVLAALLVLAFIFFVQRTVIGVLLSLFFSWVTVLSFELSTRYGRHLQSLRPDRFDPSTVPPATNQAAEARIRQVGDYAAGNVTVYSGYSPFIGYGTQLESWSFALDLTRPGSSGEPPGEFDVQDLYEHVLRRLRTLAVPGLEIEERVFVDGSAIIDDQRFLPDPFRRPVTGIPQDWVDDLKRAPEDRARTYLAVHSTGWNGELVSSLFLRFARSDSNLLVEGVHTVLCPLLDRYRIIDTLMPTPGLRDVAQILSQASASTFFVLLASPARAVQAFFAEFRTRRAVRRQNKRIRQLRVFDYGARISVRQQASDTAYHRYFQKLDRSMAVKVCERRALDALVEFAEARHIDVGDLVQRQQVIVNNGIIAQGGSKVEGSSVASGDNARAFTRILNKIPLVNTD